MSLSYSRATLLHRLRKQYARLPHPVRHTVNFAYLLSIALALIIPPVLVFRNHFYDIVRVTGPSMSPYLNTDFEDGSADVHDITKSTDRILLDLYRPRDNLERGMVIAFRTPHDPERWAVKRILALQGDRVFPLAHYPDFCALQGKGLVIPYGHMWLEGDVSDSNKKDSSLDSNVYGPVSTGLVVGKATYVITSLFSRWIAVDFKHFKLPARIQKDALKLEDPDQEYQSREFEKMFRNGKAAEILALLKGRLKEEGRLEEYQKNSELVLMLRSLRAQANVQLMERDGKTHALAMDFKTLIDDILED
ncbi:hypothetical protein HC762_01740 [bacterium]|nr:hypothetical protein [bacterium]